MISEKREMKNAKPNNEYQKTNAQSYCLIINQLEMVNENVFNESYVVISDPTSGK